MKDELELRNSLLGSWTMISWTYVILETGEKRDALGPNPTGSLVYTPERVTVFVLKTDRKKPTSLVPTVEEKIALYDTLFVYAGTYAVYQDRVIHHLDMSWNEFSTGTEQLRFYKLQGSRLTLTSPPAKNPFDGREAVHEVLWERLDLSRTANAGRGELRQAALNTLRPDSIDLLRSDRDGGSNIRWAAVTDPRQADLVGPLSALYGSSRRTTLAKQTIPLSAPRMTRGWNPLTPAPASRLGRPRLRQASRGRSRGSR